MDISHRCDMDSATDAQNDEGVLNRHYFRQVEKTGALPMRKARLVPRLWLVVCRVFRFLGLVLGGGFAFAVGEGAAEDSAYEEYCVCYCPQVDHSHCEAHVLQGEEEYDSRDCQDRCRDY